MAADTDVIVLDSDPEVSEPKAPEPEPPSDTAIKMYGAPYLIIAYIDSMQPERFPMMRLDPAIDAARAIIRDGSYFRVVVIDAYHGTEYAIFNRWSNQTAETVKEQYRTTSKGQEDGR